MTLNTECHYAKCRYAECRGPLFASLTWMFNKTNIDSTMNKARLGSVQLINLGS